MELTRSSELAHIDRVNDVRNKAKTKTHYGKKHSNNLTYGSITGAIYTLPKKLKYITQNWDNERENDAGNRGQGLSKFSQTEE